MWSNEKGRSLSLSISIWIILQDSSKSRPTLILRRFGIKRTRHPTEQIVTLCTQLKESIMFKLPGIFILSMHQPHHCINHLDSYWKTIPELGSLQFYIRHVGVLCNCSILLLLHLMVINIKYSLMPREKECTQCMIMVMCCLYK